MRVFRVKLSALWRQAFPGLIAGALLARIVDWLRGEAFSWPGTVPLMIAAAAIVAGAYLLSPTLAGPRGVKAMTRHGLRRLVAWEDIVEARLTRQYFMFPSIRLLDATGRTLWISRDTKDLSDLHALATQHGGHAHPLTRALETPLHAL